MKTNDSQALCDVWKWKELAYHEVEHLSIEEALKKRLTDSLQTVNRLGLPVSNVLHETPLARVVH